MNSKEFSFTWHIIIIAVIIELLWFFAVWVASFKTPHAALAGTILLPACALLFLLLPSEKRKLCSGKDLKLLNDLARGAFFGTAAYSVMMLLGIWKYLSVSFVKNYLFYTLIGEFALHAFAILIFTCLALIAPANARKKPLKLAAAIYIISTIMQIVVFSETMLAIQNSFPAGR